MASQTLVKKPTESGLKKGSTVVVKFIEELVKIGNYMRYIVFSCSRK